MITYRLNDLKEAVAAINKAEIALAKKENAQSRLLIKEAKELVAKLPITEAQANDPAFNAIFTKSRLDAKIMKNMLELAKLRLKLIGINKS